VCAAAYAITVAWLPTVRESALTHRGPFPWQFEALRLSHEKASTAVASSRGRRRKARGSDGDLNKFSLGDPEQPVTADKSGAAPSGSNDDQLIPELTLREADLRVEDSMATSVTSLDAGHDSDESSSSSVHDPDAIAHTVSFSAKSMAPGIRNRKNRSGEGQGVPNDSVASRGSQRLEAPPPPSGTSSESEASPAEDGPAVNRSLGRFARPRSRTVAAPPRSAPRSGPRPRRWCPSFRTAAAA